MSKQALIAAITSKLREKGLPFTLGNGTDIAVIQDFLDASWGTGKKTIHYEANAFLDETTQTIFLWEMTKETGSGLSAGSAGESSFQSGTTLFRKVKLVQYGPDGKEFEINLDLGFIPKTFKETAKENGWKFKTVIKKDKALYPAGYVMQPSAPQIQPKPTVQQTQPQLPIQREQAPVQQNVPSPVQTPPAQQNMQQSAPVQPQAQHYKQAPPPPVTPPPYYQNNGAQNNQATYNTMPNQPKKNKAAVLYWILFGLLTAFNLLMAVSGFGIIISIGCILIAAAFFVLHRSLVAGYGKTILTFLLAVILTFVLLMFSNTSKADIKPMGFSTSVNETTYKPINITDKFSKNDNLIFYSVLINKLPKGSEITSKWYYGNNLLKTLGPYIVEDDVNDQYFMTYYNQPLKSGKYKVEIHIVLNGNEIYNTSDTCTVN